MPRYLVQRPFPEHRLSPIRAAATEALRAIVAQNADFGVTWLYSYVSTDRRTMLCFYEGPDPEAIRKAAARNDLPIETITQVSILDPYRD
jgi:hypothetical protein